MRLGFRRSGLFDSEGSLFDAKSKDRVALIRTQGALGAVDLGPRIAACFNACEEIGRAHV